jgi:hypothetical protein
MAINTSELFDIMKQRYGRTSQNEPFRRAFFFALTRVAGDLESPKVGLDFGAIPEDLETNIDLDGKYFGVVCDGLDHYIQSMPEFAVEETRDLDAIYERSKGRAHTLVMNDTTVYTRTGRDTS